MTSRTKWAIALVTVAVVALVASVVTLGHRRGSAPAADVASAGALPGAGSVSAAAHTPAAGETPASDDPLAAQIQSLQDHLRTATNDSNGFATLGLYYVEEARRTVDPSYYAKADAVLKTSLSLNSADNFLAFDGQSVLASGRHDFSAALTWAKKGLAVNSYNAALYGALADAQTQLGQYAAAAASVQKMVDLRPGTASFARASYSQELRGDLPAATATMKAALDAAGNRSDRAFADYYLGELALNAGDPSTALTHFAAGLAQDPTYAALYEGRARANAALGKVDAAVTDFADAVSRVPQPTYVLEYADYLASLGRTAQAQDQYKVFLAENALFESNGVQLDTDATLYYADHGDAAKALAIGAAGIKSRPFLEMQDAYAWALHASGRDAEAVAFSRKALAPGMRNALFHFHLGMILKSLGQNKAARTELETALRINPHFNPLQAPVARAALTELGGSS